MTRDELLGRLQPPGIPAEPGHWPPALAWWILLGLVIAGGLAWLAWRYYRHRNRFFYQASASLRRIADDYRQHDNAELLLLQLATWLRRVAISTDPDPTINSLHGEQWLNYLDRNLPEPLFVSGPGRVFAEGLYRAHPRFDDEEILQVCQQWLDKLRQDRKSA